VDRLEEHHIVPKMVSMIFSGIDNRKSRCNLQEAVHSQLEADTGQVEGRRKAVAVVEDSLLAGRMVVAEEDNPLVDRTVVPGVARTAEEEHRRVVAAADSPVAGAGAALEVDRRATVLEDMENGLGVEGIVAGDTDLVEDAADRTAAAPLYITSQDASSAQYEVLVALTVGWITGHDTGRL
jgi:hypothetical protein